MSPPQTTFHPLSYQMLIYLSDDKVKISRPCDQRTYPGRCFHIDWNLSFIHHSRFRWTTELGRRLFDNSATMKGPLLPSMAAAVCALLPFAEHWIPLPLPSAGSYRILVGFLLAAARAGTVKDTGSVFSGSTPIKLLFLAPRAGFLGSLNSTDPCTVDHCAADPSTADACTADACTADPCTADPCITDSYTKYLRDLGRVRRSKFCV